MVAADSLSAGDAVDFIDTGGTVDSKGESFDCAKQNGVNGSPSPPPLLSVDCNKSLLAKLLTRSNQNSSRKCGSSSIGTHYENLYDAVEAQNKVGTTTASTAFSHSPPIAAEPGVDPSAGILECPFLIETPTGYMSVENMLSALQQEDIFPVHGEGTVKIIGQEEAVSLAAEEISLTAAAEAAAPECTVPPDEQPLSNALLERIQQDTQSELQEDPEAVVLTRVTEDGRLEKLVLSSADVRALERKNEQWRKRRKTLAPPVAQVDVESPLGAASLITRVVQFGAPVDGAIAKLPFRRSGSDGLPSSASLEVALEQQLDQSHHENMFEELDRQFSMDCLMRDYVAYEEASETQLEHNYYANALKEADEECVAIGASYELSPMMLLEQPQANGDDARAASDVGLNNVANESAAGRCHDGLAIPDNHPTKILFNGRFEMKKDTPCWTMVSTQRLTNGTSKGVPKATRRRGSRKAAAAGSCDFGANALPFRSVKNASTERPRRTYKRKAEASWSSVVGKRKMASLNGSPVSDSCLIEEIIVDEIS